MGLQITLGLVVCSALPPYEAYAQFTCMVRGGKSYGMSRP